MSGMGVDGPLSDEVATPEPDKRKRKIVNAVILSGWVLCLLTMVAIVGTALYMMAQSEGKPLPQELTQWTGLALSFIFVTFCTMVRDYLAGPPSP